MKIGIITFHFPLNCGAALQCYALEHTLESLGNEVKIINYCPWYHQNRYASYKNPFYYANKKMHEPARNIFTRVYHGVKGFQETVKSWKNGKKKIIREQKFNAFRKAHLRQTRMYRTLRQLKAFPPRCDLYIAGSDQLWNSNLTDHKFDPAYFLNFGNDKTRRVTYAIGSFFADPEAAKKEIAPLMKRLDAVSLRETKFLADAKQAADPKTPFHIDIDPTLLLDASEYEALLPKESLEEKPYILVYTMPGPAQKQVNDAAKRLAQRTGLKLIDINGNPNGGNFQIKDQRITSPDEFLWYFKHATFVVTNSFHGTVFSLLFEKRFAAILHQETGNRVSELLDKLGLSDRYTNSGGDVQKILERSVEWKPVKDAIAKMRVESMRYLRYCCERPEAPAFVNEQDLRKLANAKPAQKNAPEPQKPAPKKAANPAEPVREAVSAMQKGSILYTDDPNAQIVLALLKKYNIKKIVVSPGTTNVPISRGVQYDPFFEVYSMVDERGAAYFAGGLAFATGEPVALSCTGATASRDYIPGLTEAYYRDLPVIAITSQHHSPCPTDLMPQMTDRTVSQNDVKRFAAILPLIKDEEDYRTCVQLVNKALYTATKVGGGPVHINLPVDKLYSFHTPQLPDVQKIDVYDPERFHARWIGDVLSRRKVALFIGAHKPFDPNTLAAINNFVKHYDAAVFCDQTSNYTGENRVLSAVAGDLKELKNLPDVIIDMGSVSGDYSASRLFRSRRVWRISEDREYHCRNGAVILEKLFFCSERFFFEQLKDGLGGKTYYSEIVGTIAETVVPELPLSNLYAASQLAAKLPKNSYLHLGILNSLRSMNFFPCDPSVRVSCNVGGFGIDGALSTALGQSKADAAKLSVCLLGDLAFFYDMNTLGNRHVGNNLRILLINNGRGVEFRLNTGLENQWGSETDDLIAAHGHFGSAKAWAESMGFHYMTADTKEQFDEQIDAFCDADVDRFQKPVVFEVFTAVADEQDALKRMRTENRAQN